MKQTKEECIDLIAIAVKAMKERDLLFNHEEEVEQELKNIRKPAPFDDKNEIRDLRELPFFSIDNVDSLDLDQLTYAEKNKIFIAVADVDALVKKGSPIDLRAQANTTSVYTPCKVFPMLPVKLSNDLTSLNEGEDRLAIITEIDVKENGSMENAKIYRGCVKNKSKLNYDAVAEGIENPKKLPQNLAEQILLQNELAQRMRNYRHELGALSLEPIQAHPVMIKEEVAEIKELKPNLATQIIENFMIAANAATTKYLDGQKFPTFRRVVRIPKNWERLVYLAKTLGYSLPAAPEPLPLENFLKEQKKKNPLTFPDISLTVIKLLGRGEYVVNFPGEPAIGHFGLALKDYSHSTAPNRRYPDLITQRLVKSALRKEKMNYSAKELIALAKHCTEKEDDAEKVERRVQKSAAAMYLSKKINETFSGLVTGAGPKGTWVRIFHPPVEGKLVGEFHNVDVGDRLKVKLVAVDIPNGFIDFIRIKA